MWKMRLISWKEIFVVAIFHTCNIALGCVQVHSNAYGIIESNGYPTQNYPNGDSCKYVIEAKHGNKVLLEFDEFDLEQSSNCVNDYLQFSEQSIGTSVKRCGNDKRPYFSRTNTVVLMFYSNSNVNGKGFRIRYKTCGGEYKYAYKYNILSPSYGISQYPNDTDCTYKMTSIDDYGFRLVFNVFSLENSTGCISDNLSIYKGTVSTSNLISKRCGKEQDGIGTTSTQLTAHFLTNSYVSDVGFNVSVFACYRLLTTDTGAISSPGYPITCEANAFCLYEMKLPIGSKLKLEFEKFVFFGEDYLKIQRSSNSSDVIFDNVTSVSDVESREFGNQIYMELKCDVSITGAWHGFKMSYYDNQGSCSKYKPCQNGGNCTDVDTKSGTYNCTCTLDYEGKTCSKKIIPCESNPCMNQGICEDIPSRNNLPPTFKCTCVGDYTGQSCETLMGSCAKYSPCQNNGQCTDINKITGTYNCACPLDYEGKNCSQLIEPCKSSPCLHGGACTNIRSRNNNPPTFSCACTEEYKGRTCDHFIDGCIEYMNDSRWQRSIGYKDSMTFCDESLQFSWYRFVSKAGPDMPTTCPDKNSCGTIGSIWINGTADLQIGSEVDMTACARNSSSCCSASWDIRMKKCQGFNGTTFTVYRLRTPPSCPMAYCAGTEMPCPTNYNSVNGFSPNCTEIHPQIIENPKIYPDVEGNRLVFKCEFNSSTVEDVARFYVSWFEEFPLEQLNKLDILKGTERIARLEVSLNSSHDGPQFKLGKTIFCKVYGWYEGRPYGRVNGPLKESKHYFAGIKVEPSQTYYTMREISRPLQFAVTVTVPIVCNISNNCSIVVRIKQDNSEIYFSLCSMLFDYRTASHVFNLAVKRDFIYGRNKQTRVKLEVENQADSVYFVGYNIPEIMIAIMEEISQYSCSSTTDPYVTPAYGGGYYQGAGLHVLAKDTTRHFEVQSRVYSCGISAGCNCALAAREGDDVVVIDFCSGGPMSARFASQREPAFGTTMYMDSSGQNFQISFPSGVHIKVYYNGRWLNIYLYIPREVYPTFAGACRSRGSWVAVTQNLFFYYDGVKTCRKEKMKQYCICGGASITGYKEDCTIKSLVNRKKYYDSLGKSILLLHPTAKLCNTKVEGPHITLPEPEPPSVVPTEPQPPPSPGPTPTWPTATGKTESDVKAYCDHTIRNSAVGRACALIAGFPFQNYIDECLINVKLSDTYDYTVSTLVAMQTDCGDIFQGNESLWVEDSKNNDTTGLPPEFRETLCPGLCNGRGDCVKGKCVCNENYTSIDCSVDKRKGPTLSWIRHGSICDLRTRPNCHLVRIVGSNFMVATKSACRSTKLEVHASGSSPTSDQNLHRVDLISFSEVMCTTSSLSSSHAAYSIDVTNDGSIFSSTGLPYVIYDSKCMNCSHASSSPTVCSIKKNTCNIDGSCYLLGEASKSDPYAICNPSLNQTAFTKDHFAKIRSRPKLSVFVKNKRLTFGCEFETEKNESRARFEVTWFELPPMRQINRTHTLKGFERNAIIHSDHLSGNASLFALGTTIFCRVRSWYINTSVSHIPGPYHESNHYFAGIKVEPKRQVHLISESGNALKLTVSATVPIACSNGNSCRILIQMTTDNSESLLSVCALEFKPGPAPQSQIVNIAAFTDFVLDGSQITKLRLTFSRKGHPVGWNDHRAIPDVLIKTTNSDTRICQSTGDPHITTYDGLYFDHYQVGTYLLAKSHSRNFEVHVRTHKCSTVSCNCGVAAREDNDVIVIDFCKGAIQTARFASKGTPANGTKLLRDKTGKNFIIKFPSGSFVRVNVHTYVGSYYANLVVQARSDDFRGTTGLCGTFDGNPSNDMKDISGQIRHYTRNFEASTDFTESYLLNSRKQLFNYNDDDHRVQSSIKFCSCVSNSIGISNVTCKYKASPRRHLGSIEGWVELVPPNGNIELKGSPNAVVILPLNEDDTNYEFEPENMTNVIPQWPTPSNRTKLAVEAYCNNIIRHSTSGKICSIIPSFPFHHFVLQCITDIQITDTDDFTISTIQSMQFACEEIFMKNMTYWKPNVENNGALEPPSDLKNEMCPGLCSGNGICLNSTCRCNDPYIGDDCSINKNIPPQIESVGMNGLCDVQNRSNCHIVKIRGSGFLDNEKLGCRITKLRISEKSFNMTNLRRMCNASLLSFKEIACDIGNHSVATNQSDRSPSDGYMIEVTNDGLSFSQAQAVYLIYDSTCMECNGTDPACKQKAKTCIISGKCHREGESTGSVECDPKTTSSTSTNTQTNTQPPNSGEIIGNLTLTASLAGSFASLALILAIISLVVIRRKQKEDKAESEIESEAAGALELGKVNLSLFGDYEELEDDRQCDDIKEVLKKSSSHEEIISIEVNRRNAKEDVFQCLSKHAEAGKSECKSSKNCKEEDKEERYVKVFGAGLQREDEEEPVVKNAEIVVQNYLADGDCAEVNAKKPVDIMESNEDGTCGSEEVAVNDDEAEEMHKCPSSVGLTVEDVKPGLGVESKSLNESPVGKEDFNAGISNLCYEESFVNHESRA